MEAFTDKDQFFHGVGVDGVYLPFHKANQFLGMEALPTFIANDVIKMPDVHGISQNIASIWRKFWLTRGLCSTYFELLEHRSMTRSTQKELS